MNPVTRLAQTELQTERYHADGHGHLQVETISYPFDESPAELLDQIDQAQRWPEFLAMAKGQPEAWRLQLLEHLPESCSYGTELQLALLECDNSRDAQLFLLQRAPHWHWNRDNIEQLPAVIERAQRLLQQTEPLEDAAAAQEQLLSAEIERQMLTDLLEQLSAVQASQQPSLT